MGYDTFTFLSIPSKGFEQEVPHIKKWINDNKYPFSEWRTWYRMEEDSIILSQKFPDVTFAFTYFGESGNCYEYFTAKSGEYTPIAKIPYNIKEFKNLGTEDNIKEDDLDDFFDKKQNYQEKILHDHIDFLGFIRIA